MSGKWQPIPCIHFIKFICKQSVSLDLPLSGKIESKTLKVQIQTTFVKNSQTMAQKNA